METKPLGRSGLRVSVVGLGCNNFGMRCDQAQTRAVVAKALDLGVTLFDTADVYGPRGVSEEYLGKALENRRGDIVLATKFAMPMGDSPLQRGGSRRWVMKAAEASLRRLGTDYIDLYQMHFPDAGTPIEETLRALDDLVRAGQGPVPRLLELQRLAGGRGRLDREEREPVAVRLRAELLQPDRAQRRARAGAGVQRVRARRAAVLPARERAAHREVPARPGGARGHAARRRRASRRRSTRRTSTGSRSSRRSRPTRVTRCSSWRSAGSRASRTCRA